MSDKATAKALEVITAHLPGRDAGASWCNKCKTHVEPRAEHLLRMLHEAGIDFIHLAE